MATVNQSGQSVTTDDSGQGPTQREVVRGGGDAQVDPNAFEIQGRGSLDRQGDELAAYMENYTLDTSNIDRASARMGALGEAISSRIGTERTLSAQQAQELRNMAQNIPFAPGASLRDQLNSVATTGGRAANQAAALRQQEGARMSAQAAFARQANINADLQTKVMMQQIEATKNQSALAVKQGKQGLDLAQKTLNNQLQALVASAANAEEALAIERNQADIEFGFKVAGAAIQAASTVTAALGEIQTQNAKNTQTSINDSEKLFNPNNPANFSAQGTYQGPGLTPQEAAAYRQGGTDIFGNARAFNQTQMNSAYNYSGPYDIYSRTQGGYLADPWGPYLKPQDEPTTGTGLSQDYYTLTQGGTVPLPK